MKNIDWIGILIALWTSGVLTAVGHAGVNLIKANTKNKNILMAMSWANQGVQFAENNFKTSEAKKKAATNFLYDRLIANNLPFKFSDDQVNAFIESAVAKLHDWHPEIKEDYHDTQVGGFNKTEDTKNGI